MGELLATGFTRLSAISLYGVLQGRICQPMICSCKLLIETNIILLWKASEESCLHRVAIIHSKNKTRVHFTRATYQKTMATFTLEEIFSGWNDVLQWSAMFPDLFRHFFTLFGSGGIYIYTKIDMLQWSAMFPDLFRHFFTLFGSGGIYIYTKIVFGFLTV